MLGRGADNWSSSETSDAVRAWRELAAAVEGTMNGSGWYISFACPISGRRSRDCRLRRCWFRRRCTQKRVTSTATIMAAIPAMTPPTMAPILVELPVLLLLLLSGVDLPVSIAPAASPGVELGEFPLIHELSPFGLLPTEKSALPPVAIPLESPPTMMMLVPTGILGNQSNPVVLPCKPDCIVDSLIVDDSPPGMISCSWTLLCDYVSWWRRKKGVEKRGQLTLEPGYSMLEWLVGIG